MQQVKEFEKDLFDLINNAELDRFMPEFQKI